MPNDWFQFKQFLVHQDRCGMKVGTDAVILGAWTRTEEVKKAVDVGTGTGLLALMLCQRSSLIRVTGIEIDRKAAEQAIENTAGSRFSDRIIVYNDSFQHYCTLYPETETDLVICNPPFFTGVHGTGGNPRSLARHEDQLTLDQLFFYAQRILRSGGLMSLILPYERFGEMELLLQRYSLFKERILYVRPTPEKEIHRFCAEIGRNPCATEMDEIVIETGGRHVYSHAFSSLTEPFYL